MKLPSLVSFLFAALPLLAQVPTPPTAEHQKLAASAGTWDVLMETVGEDGKPVQGKGTSTQRLGCGGLWLLDDFTSANFMGGPFDGHGVTGYDPAKGKYVLTWVDSWTTSLMFMEGSYDKDGKVLTMTGTGVGMDNKPAKYRHVTTWKNADSFVFEMFVTGADGKEAQMMTITYTRRAAKPEDAKAGKK